MNGTAPTIAFLITLASALAAARSAPAQQLMMNADGAIQLDDAAGFAPGAPVVINQEPDVLAAPQAPLMLNPPVTAMPYGGLAPAMPYAAPGGNNPNLGPLARLRNAGLQWVVGAEFLYARATFSEALAYTSFDAAGQFTDFETIEFDFEPSYSIYGGAFVSDWGGALIVDFTRLESEADFAAQSTPANTITSPFPGADVSGTAHVDVKTYDLSFAKSLYLGGANQSVAAGAACPPSQPTWEPAWELGFEGGFRFADVEWARTVARTDGLAAPARAQLAFDGYGPRVGLLGRRYVGKRGWVSMYAKGAWSLLWGDVDQSLTLTPSTIVNFSNRSGGDRLVPVTEIELGLSTHLGDSISLSAGYFWSAWHDLGMSDETPLLTGGTHDDANILGFDGLFARGEVAY